MPSCSKSTKARLLLFELLFALALQAQSAVPDSTAAPDRWRVHLTFDKAALSGLCLVRTLGDTLVGAVVNEFGLQAFDFIFDRRRGKVQLSHLLPMLDHLAARPGSVADRLPTGRTAPLSQRAAQHRLSLHPSA